MLVSYSWRGNFSNEVINKLHAEAFDDCVLQDDWWTQVHRHSLGWVCAEDEEELVGFVNVVWDGGIHAFLIDTMVRKKLRGRGVGKEMIEIAVRQARIAGCEWLHVDFEDHLRDFYFGKCGFEPTNAGLIALK